MMENKCYPVSPLKVTGIKNGIHRNPFVECASEKESKNNKQPTRHSNPARKNLENMEKDFFMFISAICYSAVASLLLSIC